MKEAGVSSRETAISRIIAVAVGAGVIGVVGFVVYDGSLGGFIGISAEIFGAALIPCLVAAWVKARKLVWHLIVIFAALLSLAHHSEDILWAYDIREFQTEVRVAGAGSEQETINNSTTRTGTFIRYLQEVRAKTNIEISTIILELDDPSFVDSLSLDLVTDPRRIAASLELTSKKLALAQTAMQRIDMALSSEREVVKEILLSLPDKLRGNASAGYDRGTSDVRQILLRQVEIYGLYLEELDGILNLLKSHSGNYAVSNEGMIKFESDVVAEDYNNRIGKLKSLTDVQMQLTRDAIALEQRKARFDWIY